MNNAYENVIEEIVQSIFTTMLDADLIRVDDAAPADHESLLSTVQIAGQWMGSVVLTLSPEVAHSAAVSMLSIPDQEVTEADKQEVAAELANMVGGNLKSVLPGPSFLSLPTIVAGREFGLQVHNAELVDDVVMRSQSGSLRVRLYAQLPDAAS